MRLPATIVALCLSTATTRAEPVDLELVLAMDASASISNSEYLLQIKGTAAAFRDPEVQSAIRSGPYGRIAVAVSLWSDQSLPRIDTGWHVLSDKANIEQFADLVRRFKVGADDKPELGWGGGTFIGEGVMRALEMLDENGHDGLRRVIDVSGDGPETFFEYAQNIKIGPARATAQAAGVTINGLPIITNQQPTLEEYYRTKVVAGPGAFVVPADGFEDFARAIREKLLREIQISVGNATYGKSSEIAVSQAQLPGRHHR